MGHSVRMRLLEIAKKSERRFDAVVSQYIQERFLYRLSISEYKKNLILKGALLLLVNDITKFRPTKDIDFLGCRIINTQESLIDIIGKIISCQCDDGLTFFPGSIECEIIKEGADYEGKRIRMEVQLDSMRNILQLDIGFGDKTLKGAVEIDFPTLLKNPVPKIYSYPLESVIAEKIEIIVKLNYFTSRMKDFYDIYFLATLREYDRDSVLEAVRITFQNRETGMDGFSGIFSPDFFNDPDKAGMWDAFLAKNQISVPYNFPEIMDKIITFVQPVILENDGKKRWDPVLFQWV